MKDFKLSSQNKRDLLSAVRATIEDKLFGSATTSMPDLSDRIFDEHFGLFVTLHLGGRLRGCIGYVEGVKAIRKAVAEMAINAAFHDPRFYPLSETEYPEIEIEISILYPLQTVEDIEEIEVGRDGLVLELGRHRGLLLPQVAAEYGWDRTEFLNQTCRKAGIEPYAWEDGATVYRFEAVVFGEKEER